MARPLYSERFIALQGLSGTSGSVTVPAGKRIIIKQLTGYSNPLANAYLYFEDDASGAALWSCGTQGLTPGWFGFYGALVFDEGQGFHFHTAVTPPDAWDCYAGGYVLDV